MSLFPPSTWQKLPCRILIKRLLQKYNLSISNNTEIQFLPLLHFPKELIQGTERHLLSPLVIDNISLLGCLAKIQSLTNPKL